MNSASEPSNHAVESEEQQTGDRTRHAGNKLFQAWIKDPLFKWFIEYLQKISYGETTADQFRMFLFHLQELDEKHQVLVNPREDRKKELLKTNPQYGVPESEICIRNKDRKGLLPLNLIRMCDMCKIQVPEMYQACQELKEERRNALR